MYSFMWTKKHEGEVKTLRLRNDPVSRGMDVYEDVDGNRWDVNGVFRHDGKTTVWAQQVDEGFVWRPFSAFEEWVPYRVEVVA